MTTLSRTKTPIRANKALTIMFHRQLAHVGLDIEDLPLYNPWVLGLGSLLFLPLEYYRILCWITSPEHWSPLESNIPMEELPQLSWLLNLLSIHHQKWHIHMNMENFHSAFFFNWVRHNPSKINSSHPSNSTPKTMHTLTNMWIWENIFEHSHLLDEGLCLCICFLVLPVKKHIKECFFEHLPINRTRFYQLITFAMSKTQLVHILQLIRG